jgi:hypothetical protein
MNEFTCHFRKEKQSLEAKCYYPVENDITKIRIFWMKKYLSYKNKIAQKIGFIYRKS